MAPTLDNLITTSATQGNPISALRLFLEREARHEEARNTAAMRFVGFVLELGYETAKIITSDPYKIAVGGIPRGSFLIMAPENSTDLPPHFTLLRVNGVSPTPLSNQVQQTYFELHKKSMPELDVWTQGELQWGALDCDVLGMFYAEPSEISKLAFSGDVNNVVSAHRYRVYSPDDELLNVIVNGLVRPQLQFELGELRTTECKLRASGNNPQIPAQISLLDFKGCRTAMFGKTRLGKSNTVKRLAQGMLEATAQNPTVGQLIFDINGEYANDNPQDGDKSIRSAYEDRCVVYALTRRSGTPSRPLRFNFYETPDSCMQVIASMLEQDNQTSIYIRAFASVQLPSIAEISSLQPNEKARAIRKVQMYWAILRKAGFLAEESRLRDLGLTSRHTSHFNPGFSAGARNSVYGAELPPAPQNLDQLVSELEAFTNHIHEHGDSALQSSSGNSLFDSDDLALLKFLKPSTGAGPTILRSYRVFHDPQAGSFSNEILDFLDAGKTVILDLGNATDTVRRYFSDIMSKEVFSHQEKKFVGNGLGDHFIQLYFEEAHNLFPPESKDLTGVYARFAKEGAKFHIGMVYSTQSPSTINKDLLAQTENFFVGHLSSQDEARSLSRVQVAFAGQEQDILRAKTPGYMRMLTLSHRFVLPVQVHKFEVIDQQQDNG